MALMRAYECLLGRLSRAAALESIRVRQGAIAVTTRRSMPYLSSWRMEWAFHLICRMGPDSDPVKEVSESVLYLPY